MSDETFREEQHKLYPERVPNDAPSPEELIQQALAVGDPDEHAYWDAVTVLWHRAGREVLEAARTLCRSDSPIERELGVNILSQLGSNSEVLHEERLQTLLSVLNTETNSNVLGSACTALGHLRDTRANEALIRFKDHPDEVVRWGLVFGLTNDPEQEAFTLLIALSKDVADYVRDWATFKLGTAENPSIEALNALADRVSDEDNVTRGEAIVGLARNKDERAVEPLIKYLDC